MNAVQLTNVNMTLHYTSRLWTYDSRLGLFIFDLQILCENNSTVLATLNEEKLFGEVSAHYKTRVHEVITKHLQPRSNVKILKIFFERATVLEKGNRSFA